MKKIAKTGVVIFLSFTSCFYEILSVVIIWYGLLIKVETTFSLDILASSLYTSSWIELTTMIWILHQKEDRGGETDREEVYNNKKELRNTLVLQDGQIFWKLISIYILRTWWILSTRVFSRHY